MSALISEMQIETNVRAATYAFLARSVQYPRHPIDCGLLDIVRFEDDELEDRRTAVVRSSGSDVPSLQAAHRVLFPAVESQDAPSYATAYSKRDVFRQGQVMADAAGFYRAHGLTLGGKQKDRPDGIGPELEFMGFLAQKQGLADSVGRVDAVQECIDTQALFLRDHLGAWGPDYGRRMAAVSAHPFFRSAGAFLTFWLEAEIERFGVIPHDPDHLPIPDPHDDVAIADPHLRWDDLSCGGGM